LREDLRQKELEGVSLWRAAFGGFCVTLLAVGLSRFAYTPLVPALVGAQWLTSSEAAYLGAANLAGYLAGALLARPAAARMNAVLMLRAMMVVGSATFFACAIHLHFLWFFIWRFASGVSGGALVVLVAPALLPHIPIARRGLVSGVIFTGVGAGAAISGLVMPLLLARGVVQAWLGLGIFATLLTVLSWSGWPKHDNAAAPRQQLQSRPAQAPLSFALKALCLEYGFAAIGLVPHMVFFVDFIARGLGRGIDVGAYYWVLFGLSATAGSVFAGHLADRIGFAPALRGVFLALAGSVGLLAFYASAGALAVSSIVVGAFLPGTLTLVLGRSHELVPAHDVAAQGRAWSLCTTAFAVCQAVGAYGFSYIFSATRSDYSILFKLGGAAFLAALALDLIVALVVRPATMRP